MTRRFTGSSEGIKFRNFTLSLLILGAVISVFSNIEIYASEPWAHFYQMLSQMLIPLIEQPSSLALDLLYTLSFALLGVCLSVLFGFALSLFYQHWLVSAICTFFRAIHELFWALIFIQIFGLSSTSAILAIAIPYACTFARVFADIYQQAPLQLSEKAQYSTAKMSYFLYVVMPQVWPQMTAYTRYRFECGVRTSAVLGFVGLPTIGFHLETAFKQGDYSYASALLLSFYLLIASIKYWMKLPLLPLYLLAALYFLPSNDFINSNENIWRFISRDIWPQVALSEHGGLFDAFLGYLQWFAQLFASQGLQGVINTLALSVMALALTAFFCLCIAPVSASLQRCWPADKSVLALLLVMRSTPEYILAFVFLLLLGPSMLPAIIALAIHNAGLICFLLQKNVRVLTANQTVKFSDYLYKIMPISYPQFISLLLYRCEMILRESAILGVLGITTLGFYIDSAFEDLRFERAFALLLITALLNIIVDQCSRKIQLIFSDNHIRVRSKE